MLAQPNRSFKSEAARTWSEGRFFTQKSEKAHIYKSKMPIESLPRLWIWMAAIIGIVTDIALAEEAYPVLILQ